MDTVTPQLDLQVLESRRAVRRRLRPALVPLLIVAAVLIGALGYVLNYMPLVPGAIREHTGTCTKRVGEFGQRGSEDLFEVYELTCSGDGDDVILRFNVRNSGPLPITVTGIDAEMGQPFVATTVSISADRSGGVETFEPFRAFRLAVGEERWFQIATAIRTCSAPNDSSGFHRYGWKLSYRVGWITRSDTYHRVQFRGTCPP